jgi:hypothetical protein
MKIEKLEFAVAPSVPYWYWAFVALVCLTAIALA